ncbi:hypothetical protein IKW75_01815 [Candidatus Saccharibacteria bacterium]|nr:hypothetical protein [Candidatus Saccharibacteria bacterium]
MEQQGVFLEPHEASTILHLTQFGFNIEVIKPTNANRAKSADIFMLGATWEIKSPTTSNLATIKADFRKARSQADRIIFDLRRTRKNVDSVEKQVITIFKERGSVRRLIIIKKNGKAIDYIK